MYSVIHSYHLKHLNSRTMRLFIYNKENTISTYTRGGERTIRINRTNGVVYFSRILADMLKLKDNERVVFANDEDNPKDWYLSKTNDENGFLVKNEKTGVRFISTSLCNKILDSVKIQSNATFLVANKPINDNGATFFKIIVSNPLKVNEKRKSPNKGMR